MFAACRAGASVIQAEPNADAERLQGRETDYCGLGGVRDEESLGHLDHDRRSVPV